MIETRVLRISTLTAEDKRLMFALFVRYYDDVTPEQFYRDLAEKTDVFYLQEVSTGRLVGFSTIKKTYLDKPHFCVCLFSGDTVIDKLYWGRKNLQIAFSRYIFNTKMQNFGRPVYWFLISKGFKTYMMLRRNFRISYPNFKRETPAPLQAVLQHFYENRYGCSYDPKTSLIQGSDIHGMVRNSLARPDPEDEFNPDIAFFLHKNPNYFRGVELACISEVCIRDFIGHFLKYLIVRLQQRKVRYFGNKKGISASRSPNVPGLSN
jgi:hypothetical protein